MVPRKSITTVDAHGNVPSSSALAVPPALPHHGGSKIAAHDTWLEHSDDSSRIPDVGDVEDRGLFVQEYNALARKHGIRLLLSNSNESCHDDPHRRRGWFSRMFLRQTSGASIGAMSEKGARHKRSISDLAMHVVQPKKDFLKDEDLQDLVRLCGKSFLYLPPGFAPGPLVLPTCLRATAQYLVQHATQTRGLFRIPGSVRIVNALYEYYCAEQDATNTAGTVRTPSLPMHIQVGVHDVASTFKKFLAGLPGGILGSLPLFDALVAIKSQLQENRNADQTKQSKLRSKLLALAFGTLESQFRRELICAVFGILSLVGHAAENAASDDQTLRPPPASDLMGYNALSIVFGPLLIGDLIDAYDMKLSDPAAGLLLFLVTPPRSKKEKRKSRGADEAVPSALTVDKIRVASEITEMLIANWTDVVKHMKALGILRKNSQPHSHNNNSGPISLSAFLHMQMPEDLMES
ncbi:RhoGAP domain-containing protein [Pleurostoma richardsiae]|uniref:RhoGAP domain-containing protein n=1 Tax=Pleurostoma richardsiae TaxID=41990 RepID=A0AA38RAG3_9PEZI|nr:RhoGAP domain-containing protein [Pleurostoma richardsiae]